MRLLSACLEFKRRHFVLDFLYYPREDGAIFSSEHLDQLAAFFNVVHLVPSEDQWPGFREKYQESTDIWNDRIGDYFSFLNKRIHYDFVYANYAPYAHIFRYCGPETVRVLDTHDKLANRRDFLESQGHKPDFFSLSTAEEGQLSAMANVVIAIKDAEADYYREISSRPVITIGVPVEIHQSEHSAMPTLSSPEVITFGFIGSDNAVNRLALIGLFDIVSGRAAVFIGRARFVIVGRVLDAVPIPSNLLDIVEHVRFVDELSEFYDRCHVILVPTIRSTGLKIKSVEALGYGKPIIATADGFDGIESPYSFHTCPNQTALVEVCEAAIAKTLTLGELTQATERVRENYMRSYEANVEALARICGKWRVAVVLREHATLDTFYASLFSLLRFFQQRCKVSFYYHSPTDLSPAMAKFMKVEGHHVSVLRKMLEVREDAPELIVTQDDSDMSWTHPIRALLTISSDAISLRTNALRDAGTADRGFSADCPTVNERRFTSVRALDFVDQPHWGARKRITIVVSPSFTPFAANFLLNFASAPEFTRIKGDYTEFRIVSFLPRDDISAAAQRVGFRNFSYRDQLFSDPWGARKHLIFLGSFTTDDQIYNASTLVSIASTTVFVQDEKLLTMTKIICGADVWVGRFSNHLELVSQLAWVNRERNKPNIISRYRPNRGVLSEIIEGLKQHFINDIIQCCNA